MAILRIPRFRWACQLVEVMEFIRSSLGRSMHKSEEDRLIFGLVARDSEKLEFGEGNNIHSSNATLLQSHVNTARPMTPNSGHWYHNEYMRALMNEVKWRLHL